MVGSDAIGGLSLDLVSGALIAGLARLAYGLRAGRDTTCIALGLTVEQLRARQTTKSRKVKLKVAIASLAVASGLKSCKTGRGLTDACAAHRHSLLVLFEFGLETFNLSAEKAILVLVGLGSLCQTVDSGFKVLEMLLLAFSECSLSSAVLSLAFLMDVR